MLFILNWLIISIANNHEIVTVAFKEDS